MSLSVYGRKLNSYRRAKEPLGIKGVRQSVVITHNPCTNDENRTLLVRFLNLVANDVIVPESVKLAFTIVLKSTVISSQTIVNNIGRAIVKKTTIKISGNEVMSIDDLDVFQCYMDLWKSKNERSNAQYQGIDSSAKKNVTLLPIGATDADDGIFAYKAIAYAYNNRFFIPLDFKLLKSHMPFYQSALGDRLEYELVFNDCKRV
ncbi:hypothetical protein CAPTEDRAFT_186024 [Capitella teleta]|uniref:Uncharacterized protein n=1 Tax=Capitella teleta TaxID=283909 RepID=R7VCD8_CAPTE|nr:hypothetical protein CAPTEDRAFT_186024 [Capitella teleta]|eukprot:ELU13350.1 hypothetical protein CAPTEDRAFT_186024 [Capitella teleta]